MQIGTPNVYSTPNLPEGQLTLGSGDLGGSFVSGWGGVLRKDSKGGSL